MTLTYLDLFPEQRASLDELAFDGNHLVSGPPGSGKSLLAAQRAVMLALTGTPVTLLTRSNLLRQSLAAVVHKLGPPDRGVRVATAHAWLTDWYGGRVPRTGDDSYDWEACYDRAAETGPVPDLTLVVDEGQDLPPEFYRLCRLLQARTTVYADECQRLTDTNSTLAEITQRLGRCTLYELDGNHRNTRQIAAFAAHFHTGTGMPALPEREGPPPRLHRLPHRGAVDLLILLAQKHPQQSIGVIVNSTHTQFSLLGSLERRGPRLKPQLYTCRAPAAQSRYRTLDLGRPGIVLVHRASAKGLGFDVVVIPDTHTDAAVDPTSAALRMTYYVLATRARRELHLAYEGETEPPLCAQVGSGNLLRG
ncbi:superfamily I DNA/RNA helicase [Streptomyces umbrinus]|uniref:Superfamily I DNA/RNA helicase n=1 Tax=Streptomyces umbrinus TaxID=67370 RepID=A0ABU0T1P6_9ACTN|nr:AAA family ATPase [Streptomyces umbrinus]MDQ1029730.1 superfamily I DNA/RNA helicase [Streptomyces umbrinus]